MADRGQDRLLGHDYDGITEYDNPLPGWWVWLFWATILFSVLYWGYYHLGPGPSVIAEYEAETRAVAEGTRTTPAGGPGAPSEETLALLAKDAQAVARGQEIFAVRCVACHGPQGQGLIGPNLTDEFWIHGTGTLTDILRVVSDGVPEKGMVPWKFQLGPPELASVTVYVRTLRGTHPPNPKPPEGQKVSAAPPSGRRLTALASPW